MHTIMFMVILLISSMVYSQEKKPFVPRDFKVPKSLETNEFMLRMLKVTDVIKDYDAVMSSVEHLQKTNPDKWPPRDLSMEQDLIDLGWHQKEFQMRSSFAYTVITLDESRILGCVYIMPTLEAGIDAKIYMWVRKSEYDEGLDPVLFRTVKNWIEKEWLFGKVSYPGRNPQTGEYSMY